MGDWIYLDHNATTPCDPRVVEAMLEFLGPRCGNPSSRSHAAGRHAADALESARGKIASLLGARRASEIVFTSGATEANTLALGGVARGDRGRTRRHIVTQATEHPSVLGTLRQLQRDRFEVTIVGVGRDGRIDPAAVTRALRDDTLLVSLMLANNETGTIQPVAAISDAVRARGALLHCDAAQGVGRLAVDVDALGADLLTFSAHKMYGPPGAGGLFVSRRASRPPLVPILEGGGQERGLRAGTVNLPGVVGMARALELAVADLETESRRLAGLRGALEGQLMEAHDGVTINGAVDHRLPGTGNLSFAGIDGSALLTSLPDLAISSGAACSADRPEPSAVLRAMGVSRRLASASLRFGLGRSTTAADCDRAAVRIIEEVTRLRQIPRR